MKFNTGYNFDGLEWSNQSGLECKDKTLAQQQFRDECDINILFGKYLESGEMPQVQDGLTYGNFEGIFDYQTAMNAVRTAEGLFQQLPARIKNRFDNDPQRMLQFLADENNREEADFLGLTTKEKTNDAGTREDGAGNKENETRPTGTGGTKEETEPTKTT